MLSRIRRRASYANVMATLAMFVALGGTSYAAVVLTGANIKDGTLTSKDVKDRSLLGADFKAGQLPAGEDGARGAAGAPGSAGAPGAPGAAGGRGADGSPDSPSQVLAKLTGADGPGSGLDADLLDGHEFADAQSRFTTTVVVHGDAAGNVNGAALLAAMEGITTNSPTRPFVVFLEPGIYNLGAQTLTLKPDVTLVGSGILSTTIQSAFPGAGAAVAVGSTSSDPGMLRDLRIDGSGLGAASGLAVPAGKYVVVENVDIGADGGTGVAAITLAGTLVARHSQVRGSTAGADPSGLIVTGTGSGQFDDVEIAPTSTAGNTTAVRSSSTGQLTFRDTLFGGTPNTEFGIRYALRLSAAGTITVERSQVDGLLERTAGSMRIGASRVGGSALNSSGITCTGNYSSTFTGTVQSDCRG
ncbi:MAG: hypothetical protein JWM98_894 [Thermoleophilia bacterium]|nr:hypothetical protein [Thermoleophilia bacterium]